jgi:hypothetical protein
MTDFRTIVAAATSMILFLSACGSAGSPDPTDVEGSGQVAAAEAFVDAFYSFDATALGEILVSAPESRASILSYQGWAEGAHYKVLERHGCEIVSPDYVECPVTVEDDLLLSLGSDFKVTDQFNIHFDGPSIVSVTTGSNDPEIVALAFEWVFANRAEFADGPCRGYEDDDLETPQACAVAVTTAFREFAASDDFPGS